ncbi:MULTISPECIES: hypothetical protein [Thermomonosporaceae]|nr:MULTISPECIES: hypothetical protein [Thermomonosporaceae]MDL4770768.1 hypothetical protein [Actinomadura xylanilytica]
MGDLRNAVMVGGASGLGRDGAQALAANGRADPDPDLHAHVTQAFA